MPSMQRILPSERRRLSIGHEPIYNNGITFTLNPALSAEEIALPSSSSSSSSAGQIHSNPQRCHFYVWRPKLHEARANQFVTLPPVTDLRCWYRDRGSSFLMPGRVHLHAKDGVTLKHVDFAVKRAEMQGGYAFGASVVGSFRLRYEVVDGLCVRRFWPLSSSKS